MTIRTAYISGLRRLADLLESDPDFPLPYTGGPLSGLKWIVGYGKDQDAAWQRDFLRRFARAVDGPVQKGYRDEAFDLVGKLDGLHLDVIAQRDAVCERVITGTREVTREVPDPDALAAVPTTTVTETVEDVRWECVPLTAPEPVEVPA
jgi:hypothetical protein